LQQTIISGLPYAASDYSVDSFAALQQAMNAGRKVRDNANSTVGQLNAAMNNIQAAIKHLVKN
ncbi:hypothetical protein HF964_09670, partial [Weissella fabalis]